MNSLLINSWIQYETIICDKFMNSLSSSTIHHRFTFMSWIDFESSINRKFLELKLSQTCIYFEQKIIMQCICTIFWGWFINRLNSENLRIFEFNVWNINLNSSNCRAQKISWNDTKLEPISWELKIENKRLAFAWVDIPGQTFDKRCVRKIHILWYQSYGRRWTMQWRCHNNTYWHNT